MKLVSAFALVFSVILSMAQNNPEETPIVLEQYTKQGETIGTALFTGLNVFSGAGNMLNGVHGKFNSRMEILGAVSGVSQMIMGIVLVSNAKTIEINQIIINPSRMNLGLLNISVGAFSFFSSIYATSKAQREKDKAVSWHIQSGPLHQGRGGIMLGYSKRF